MKWIRGPFVVAVFGFACTAWGQECSVSAIPVSFGQYISLDASSVYSQGSIRVTCSIGTGFVVRLDAGENSGGNFFPRRLRSTTAGMELDYNLFRDSAHTQVWGDGTSSTYIGSRVGTGLDDHLTVYGMLFGAQNVSGGLYRDSISVTVEW